VKPVTMLLALAIGLGLFSFNARAATAEHGLIRRIVVFPFKTEKIYSDIADDAWWAMREFLTGNQRFLIASKHFLIKKDVYQPRSSLSPADVIILGKLLDANALVVTYLEDRDLHMVVYEGEYGRVLWESEVMLHPSLPIKTQLGKAVMKLTADFIASIPYQGFVVIDPLIGKPTYLDGSVLTAKVNIGLNSKIEPGDGVQFIQLFSKNLDPLFGEGASMVITAEGRVLRVENEIATVEISRARDLKDIRELSLVRFPKEFKRLSENLSTGDSLERKISPEIYGPELRELKKQESEKKPLMAAITFIANIAVFLLLAF
jgi:hypothetical protein